MRFTVAALIAPFYDPIRLAEDLLVLDNLSRGRVDLIVAGGYVRQEFEQYGVPPADRGRHVTETVSTLRAAFSGQPFEYQGRTVHLTPGPYGTGPGLLLGGSSAAAARRAARIADGFIPSVPEVWDFYRERGATTRPARPRTQCHRGEQGVALAGGSRGGMAPHGTVLPARDRTPTGVAGRRNRSRRRIGRWRTRRHCGARASTPC